MSPPPCGSTLLLSLLQAQNKCVFLLLPSSNTRLSLLLLLKTPLPLFLPILRHLCIPSQTRGLSDPQDKSLCPHTAGGPSKLWGLLYTDTRPIHGGPTPMTSSHTHPKAHLPTSSHWGLGSQHANLHEHRHSVHSRQ